MAKLVQSIVFLRDWCNAHPVYLPWGVALVGALALTPSIWGGFSMDDHFFHVVMDGFPEEPSLKCSPIDIFAFSDGDPARNRIRMEHGMPWWTPERWQVAFFRPLSAFTHWVDWKLFGNTAWPMHVHSIFIYALLVFAVTRLYQRIFNSNETGRMESSSKPGVGFSEFDYRPWIAGLAGLFFAIDMPHGLTAGWLANRNALLSALFVVLTIYFHDRWRRDAWRPGMYLAWIALALGLLSGEAAVAAGGYLFAYALFIDRGTFLRRFATLLPYLVVVGLWRIPYRALGYGVFSSRLYTDPLADPAAFAVKIVQYWPMLLFSELAAGEPMIWNYLPGPLSAAYLAGALAFLGLVGWLMWPLLRDRAEARFWALGTLLAPLPTCAVFPQARLLMCTSIGAMALVAMFIAWRLGRTGHASSESRSPSPFHAMESPRRRRYAYGLLACWIALHGVVAVVGMPLMSLTPVAVEKTVRRDLDRMPSDPAVRDDTVVLVNALADVWGIFVPVVRMSVDMPAPRRCYELAAGSRTLTVRREDERTLVLRYGDEFLTDQYTLAFRNPARDPFKPGDTVLFDRMTVEVREVTPDGRPREAAFRFDAPLEDPSFRWMAYQNGQCEPFSPPDVGRMARINNPDMYEVVCKLLGVPAFTGVSPSWIDTPLFAWLRG